MKKISRLQYITTTPELAEKACAGGVDWIQLRMKHTSEETYIGVAMQVREICTHYGATLIINDNVRVALAANADGVHLGKTDMDPVAARQLLGPDKIIGCTANTRKDILKYSAMPVDYAGLGPFRFTTTKEKLSPIVGLQGYARIMQSLRELSAPALPVVAIGGIRLDDVAEIMARGLWGIAISGAISASEDVTATAAAFKKIIKKHSES